MSAEHKLIIRMSNCWRCGNAYEAGDKFCQDCGAAVADASPGGERPSPLAAWRHYLPDFRMDRLPAEVILIAAALAYMASAALWSNYPQAQKAFSQLKIPAIKWPVVNVTVSSKPSAPAVTPDKTVPTGGTQSAASTGAQSPAKAPEAAPHAVAPGKSADHQAAQPIVARSDAAPQTPRRSEGAPQAHELPLSSVSQRDVALPATTAEHAHWRRNSPAEQDTAVTATEPKAAPASEEVKEDLAEYNRLLAAYFESAANSTQARPEPPSYSEWMSAGKPQF